MYPVQHATISSRIDYNKDKRYTLTVKLSTNTLCMESVLDRYSSAGGLPFDYVVNSMVASMAGQLRRDIMEALRTESVAVQTRHIKPDLGVFK